VKGDNMSEQYKDRFSKATEEITKKSVYLCKSCNKNYSCAEAEEKKHSCCGRAMTELIQEGFGP
jgi:hypothetical protein